MTRVKFSAITLILLITSAMLFACKTPEPEAEIIKFKAYYTPEITLSGDVAENVKVNIPERVTPTEDGYYPLADVISFATPQAEIKKLMIFAKSAKAVEINVECLPHYYFTVTERGVVKLNSDIEMHREFADLPLSSITEVLLSAEEPTPAGFKIVSEEDERQVDYHWLIVAHGIYARINSAIYTEDRQDLTLTRYSKRVVNASVLCQGDDIVAVLENGIKVLITQESRYNVHWANGDLYFVEFASPIKYLDLRKNVAVDYDGQEE